MINYLTMKQFAFSLLLLVLFTGCKKNVEKVAEDIVIRAMTNGQWKVTTYTINGSDFSGDFESYKFQFYENKTVDGIKNGVVEKSGTWNGDATNMSISSNFTNATHPLILLNGTWMITKNSFTYVEAKQTNGSESRTLRLDKL